MGSKELDVTCIVKLLSLVACAILIVGAYARLSIVSTFERFIMSFYILFFHFSLLLILSKSFCPAFGSI